MADINTIIAKYVEIRDKVKEIGERHAQELAPYKEMMARVEVFLLSQLQEQKVDSLKGKAGTAYITRTTSATLADRQVFFDFAMQNDQKDLLDIRVAKTAVAAYKAQHGDIPPGVTWREELGVNVRRA